MDLARSFLQQIKNPRPESDSSHPIHFYTETVQLLAGHRTVTIKSLPGACVDVTVKGGVANSIQIAVSVEIGLHTTFAISTVEFAAAQFGEPEVLSIVRQSIRHTRDREAPLLSLEIRGGQE